MKSALWGCGCVGVSGVVAVCGARLIELSRLKSVDESVGAAARWVSGRMPDLGALPSPGQSGCMFYPVIERFALTGVTDTDTGRILTPMEAYRATSSTTETATWLFVGLIVSALVWTLALLRERPDRSVHRLMARATVHSAPFVLAASAVFWPVVSFWGTLGFDLADTRGVSPPIVDSDLSRTGIGVGLWMACSVATVVFARSGLRRERVQSATDNQARAGRMCAAQGVSSDGRLVTTLGPEACAPRATPHSRVGIGRLALRGATALTIVVLLCSPLVLGVVMGALH